MKQDTALHDEQQALQMHSPQNVVGIFAWLSFEGLGLSAGLRPSGAGGIYREVADRRSIPSLQGQASEDPDYVLRALHLQSLLQTNTRDNARRKHETFFWV